MNTPQLDRIEGKLDRLDERIDSVDITLAAQHVTLQEHMRRTAALEQQIEPLRRQSAMVAGAMKLILSLGTALASIEAASRFFRK